jgi:hypothetical protein
MDVITRLHHPRVRTGACSYVVPGSVDVLMYKSLSSSLAVVWDRYHVLFFLLYFLLILHLFIFSYYQLFYFKLVRDK